MDNNKQQTGRTIPQAEGPKYMRKMIAKRFAFLFAGAAAVMSPSKTEAQQIEPATTATQTTTTRATHPLFSPRQQDRVNAEIAYFEADFAGELDVVNLDHDDYTDAGATMFDFDGPDGEADPVRIFYNPQRDRIQRELLAAFNQAGAFRQGEGEQMNQASAYFPDGRIPRRASRVNRALSEHMANMYSGLLARASIGGASAMPIDFEKDGQRRRVCITYLTPSHMDEDSFMQSLAGVSTRGLDFELADLHQFVANHELAHCVNTSSGLPVWFNESMSDAYAIARHMQLNGDDGLAETVMSMRQLGALQNGDFAHYTVPVLERFMPKLREAMAEGRLNQIGARDLRDLTIELVLGENEAEARVNQQEITQAFAYGVNTIKVMSMATSIDDSNVISFKPDVPEEGRVMLQAQVDRSNAAIQHLLRPNAELDAAAVNSTEAERQYRENMDEFVRTQESRQVALEGIQARLFTFDNVQAAFIKEEGIENLPQFLGAYGASKVTIQRQREILQDYERQLSPEQNIAQGNELGARSVG